MASEKDTQDETESDDSRELGAPDEGAPLATVDDAGKEGADDEDDDQEPAHLGALRYVHAAFFIGGILVAFVSHKVLGLAWGWLADWPAAVRAVPQLVAYAEADREGYTLMAGALVGALAVIQTYRREGIRRGADEVAVELSKVTWPTREVVMNGTLVVVVASAVGTAYIAILDRFWSFLTTLVYGA
jgi:preprotein translocase subunit SecE